MPGRNTFLDIIRCYFDRDSTRFAVPALERHHSISPGGRLEQVQIKEIPKFLRITFMYWDGPTATACEVLVTDNDVMVAELESSAGLFLRWLDNQVKRRFRVLGTFTPPC